MGEKWVPVIDRVSRLSATGGISEMNADIRSRNTRPGGGLFGGWKMGSRNRQSFTPLPLEELAKQEEKDAQRWALGLSLFPRFILPVLVA